MSIHVGEDRPSLIGTLLLLSTWIPFGALSVLIMLR
jgi:hypothetical protein